MDDSVAQELARLRSDKAAYQSDRDRAVAEAKRLAADFVATMREYRIAPLPIYTFTSGISTDETVKRGFLKVSTKHTLTTYWTDYTHVADGWPIGHEFGEIEAPDGFIDGPVITTQGIACDAKWEYVADSTPAPNPRYYSTKHNVHRFDIEPIQIGPWKHFLKIFKPPTEFNYPAYNGRLGPLTAAEIARGIQFYLG
ncbi:hypothetical protein [Mycobacterium sp. 236(2023)]|uniref:hypothetical protein n=1 Tax=Mycobacterium sp. 236(2023) TaxID=3038163 RepID=UPI0024154E7B|nr:hypothetical protein [Mycobacterium sp. 236(2023)]MDG4668635.1 hypothetical protein [Mycobacterium sp. 236(2023)]